MFGLKTIYIHTERFAALEASSVEVSVRKETITRLNGPSETTTVDLSAYMSTHLGKKLFVPFPNLKEVMFPPTLEGFDHASFAGMHPNLKTLDFKDTMLSNIPQNSPFLGSMLSEIILLNTNITKIKKGTFRGLNTLKTIKFPGRLSAIGPEAFKGCSALKTIDLWNTLCAEVGERAFADCTLLQHVKFPKTLRTISDSSFRGCRDLVEVDAIAAEDFEWEKRTLLSYFEGCGELRVIRTADEIILSEIEKKERAANMHTPPDWNNIVTDEELKDWNKKFDIPPSLHYPTPSWEGEYETKGAYIVDLRSRAKVGEAIHDAFDPEFHMAALAKLSEETEMSETSEVSLVKQRMEQCPTKLTEAQQRQKDKLLFKLKYK
jgi:hypothetical protein